MKTLVSILSIISLVFITIFFMFQGVVVKNNVMMSGKLQTVFGIGLLIICICVFAFLIFALFAKINLPLYIGVNLFEIFIAALFTGIVSLFLIFKQ